MIKKVLVANRSEIACRIIKSCKEMDIFTVAIYSEVDKNALHVQLADQSVCIGSNPALQSYLDMDKVIDAAKQTGCDAIHPGYGFLAENAEFNEKVRAEGLIFIGPKPEPMRLLGSKVASRQKMIEAGVPIIPGMKGSSLKISDFEESAREMGFPVLIKASAGGGGKGMRVVEKMEDLSEAVESSMRESKSAFGSDEVFLEKYIEQPRHVEFQVAADQHGNGVYLFERECSIQRRHQKIVEECPSPVMDSELQKIMGETAVKVIQAADYDNIGTVEFLVDSNRDFYFLEVNTRIQVEHPITEVTTGIDLVKMQIDICEGKKLSVVQDDLSQSGHAMECRIYAEDGDNNFMPSSGKILFLKEPVGPGIRYDTGVCQGGEVPVFYDPIMAKLITHGKNREEARKRMINALKQTIILGVKTSINFMLEVLEHEEFINGNTYTNFIEKHMQTPRETDQSRLNAALLVADQTQSTLPLMSSSQNYYSQEMPSPWITIGKWEICNSK